MCSLVMTHSSLDLFVVHNNDLMVAISFIQKLVGLYCGFEFNHQTFYDAVNCIPQLNIFGFVI